MLCSESASQTVAEHLHFLNDNMQDLLAYSAVLVLILRSQTQLSIIFQMKAGTQVGKLVKTQTGQDTAIKTVT